MEFSINSSKMAKRIMPFGKGHNGKNKWFISSKIESVSISCKNYKYICTMYHRGDKKPCYCLKCCTDCFSLYLKYFALIFSSMYKIHKKGIGSSYGFYFHSELYFSEKPLKLYVQMTVAYNLQEVCENNGTRNGVSHV